MADRSPRPLPSPSRGTGDAVTSSLAPSASVAAWRVLRPLPPEVEAAEGRSHATAAAAPSREGAPPRQPHSASRTGSGSRRRLARVPRDARADARLNLNTVCEEAACPNIGECWKQRHATVMILGSVCTRACAFCNVATGQAGPARPARARAGRRGRGRARPEPRRRHLGRPRRPRRRRRRAVRAHHRARSAPPRPATTIEVLTPDFLRKEGALETVVAARPDVYNHNLETVPRLYPDDAARRALLRLAAPAATG